MSQDKFGMPLDLEVKPSKLFQFYLVSLFSLSLISIFVSSLALPVQLLLVVVLIVSFKLVLKKQKANQITSIKLSSIDEWEIEINHKQWLKAELTGECIVVSFLNWLNFSTTNGFGRKKIYHLLLLPDSADKDLLRRLRVRLRFMSQLENDSAEFENKI